MLNWRSGGRDLHVGCFNIQLCRTARDRILTNHSRVSQLVIWQWLVFVPRIMLSYGLYIQHVQLLTQTVVQSYPVSDELLLNTVNSATMMLVRCAPCSLHACICFLLLFVSFIIFAVLFRLLDLESAECGFRFSKQYFAVLWGRQWSNAFCKCIFEVCCLLDVGCVAVTGVYSMHTVWVTWEAKAGRCSPEQMTVTGWRPDSLSDVYAECRQRLTKPEKLSWVHWPSLPVFCCHLLFRQSINQSIHL